MQHKFQIKQAIYFILHIWKVTLNLAGMILECFFIKVAYFSFSWSKLPSPLTPRYEFHQPDRNCPRVDLDQSWISKLFRSFAQVYHKMVYLPRHQINLVLLLGQFHKPCNWKVFKMHALPNVLIIALSWHIRSLWCENITTLLWL